jgi:predicted dehydrogenase
MTLKVAIVGCGKIADAHVESILCIPHRARLVATCDREILLAEQLAVRYTIPRHYDDLDKMLAQEKPDVVHITTPPQAHLDIALRALAAGCHLYVEKPLAPTHAEAIELIDHVVASGRKLTIGYAPFFDPPALEMRRQIRRGLLGDPVHVESFFGYPLAGPFGSIILSDPTHWVHGLPGSLLQNNIDHLLNKIVEFIDDAAPHIHVAVARRQPTRFGDARDNILEEVRILVTGEKTTAYGTFSANAQPVSHFARIYGTRNTMHVDYTSRSISLEKSPSGFGALSRAILPFAQAQQHIRAGFHNLTRFARSEYHYFAGLRHLIGLFYASISDNTAPPVAYRDMLRVSAMTAEIIRQLPRGQQP